MFLMENSDTHHVEVKLKVTMGFVLFNFFMRFHLKFFIEKEMNCSI